MPAKKHLLGKRDVGTSRRYHVPDHPKADASGTISRRQYDKMVRDAGLRTSFSPKRLGAQRIAQSHYNLELAQRAEEMQEQIEEGVINLDIFTDDGEVDLKKVRKIAGKQKRVPYVKGYNPLTATPEQVERQIAALESRGFRDASIPKWVRPGETGEYRKYPADAKRNYRNWQRRQRRASMRTTRGK